MNTLPLATLIVNPAAIGNSRDSWPGWTHEFRWLPTPDFSPADFILSLEDLAASVALLNSPA